LSLPTSKTSGDGDIIPLRLVNLLEKGGKDLSPVGKKRGLQPMVKSHRRNFGVKRSIHRVERALSTGGYRGPLKRGGLRSLTGRWGR